MTSVGISLAVSNPAIAAPSPHSVAPSPTSTQTPDQKATSTTADSVDLSDVAVFLSQVDQQIDETPPAGFRDVLRNASRDVLVQAAAEGNPTQVSALESLASRLEVASDTSGLSGLTPFSLISILGD
jgi:hypothetical protein